MTRRERLENKLAKREQWAAARRANASQRLEAARQATAQIPMGQPILVGHHSEKRHRAALARSDANMRAGCESLDMAKHQEQKAAGLESQLETSIFSDDPDAIEQLEAKVAALEAEQAEAKRLNAYFRKHKTMAGYPGLTDEAAQAADARIAAAYSWDRRPVASYTLSNRNARIRQAKTRIADIKRRAARQEKGEQAGGVVIEGGEYVRVTFAEKPPRSVLDALKAAGFRWGAGSWCGRRDRLPECVQPPAL